MTTKNYKTLIAAVGVTLISCGAVFNVYDAINEYGILRNTLHPSVEAQTGGIYGAVTSITTGKQHSYTIHCKITSTTITTDNNSTTTSSGASGGGNIGGSWGGVEIEIGGNTSSGKGSSSGHSSTNVTQVEKDFWPKLLLCYPDQGYEKVTCTTYDPCPNAHVDSSQGV